MENVPFHGGDAVTGAQKTNVRGPRGQRLQRNATLCSLPVSVGHETRKERDYHLMDALDWCHFANQGNRTCLRHCISIQACVQCHRKLDIHVCVASITVPNYL